MLFFAHLAANSPHTIGVAWGLAAVALVGTLAFHLLPALLGGLLAYQLVKRLCPYLDDKPNEASGAQAIVVGGIGAAPIYYA